MVLLVACTGEPSTDELDSSTAALTVAAIPRGSTWRYWDRGGDLGSAWRGVLDDSTWASGAGPLGYGESYLRTTIGYGPSASNKYITTYFRRTFDVGDPAAVTAIRGELMFDDGLVIYLNGTRIGSASMPSGTTTATTLAIDHEANNAYQAYDWIAQRSLLRAGANTIAVEVHQATPWSSDLTFDLSLTLETAEPPPPPPPVEMGGFSRGSHWRFWDRGGDLGTAWRVGTYDDHRYDDSSWRHGPGPLGYGETYLQTTVSYGPNAADKYITTYFREQFYVDNPSVVTSMVAELMYDDGVVIYLNGTEVARRSMPPGAVTASTFALGHEANNAYETFDWNAHRGLLVPGYNIIAVEVHQQTRSSSDLVLDMSLMLRGEEAPPPPVTGEDIPRRSTWAYWDRTTAPSTYDGWALDYYDDSAWRRGAGPLGYGESYIATPVSYGASATNKNITTYFRRWFTVDAPSIDTTLIAELMYDDGVVIHLNGHEIARVAMPAGTIEPSTRAWGHEANNTYERFDWSAYSRLLVAGPNLLAIEVHQSDPTSSDLVFDLSLAVDTPAVCEVPGCGPAVPPAPNVALNGVWVGPSAVWTVGADGTIGRRAESDGEWCWCAPDRELDYAAVWGSSDDDVWIVGEQGRVLHFDGTTVAPVDAGTSNGLLGVWGSGPDDVFVVGRQGTVRRFDGAGWSSANLPADQRIESIWGASADDIWVGATEPAPYPGDPNYDGSTAVLNRWDAATGTWTREAEYTMYYGFADFNGIHGTSAGDVYAVGGYHPAGAAASYSQAVHYDGTAWGETGQTEDHYGDHSFSDVVTDGRDVWISSYSGTMVHFDGVTWTVDNDTGSNMSSIDARDGRVWAVGYVTSGGQSIVRWDGTAWVRDR